MPTAATNISLTPDGQYILVAGVYKPRVRCYDTKQLSMKFERCMDSEGWWKGVARCELSVILFVLSYCYGTTFRRLLKGEPCGFGHFGWHL